MSALSTFLSGAISLACAVVALFFMRFWRTTRDSFFIWFALSFALEAIGRGASAFLQLPDGNPAFYGLRVIAYGLIIAAIWQKNRR
ncbi:MAG TPA: DUF5985 family protein [Ramlibacter sp.]|nr:DUF5985 family protein [Ramlibacter sp.]